MTHQSGNRLTSVAAALLLSIVTVAVATPSDTSDLSARGANSGSGCQDRPGANCGGNSTCQAIMQNGCKVINNTLKCKEVLIGSDQCKNSSCPNRALHCST